MIKILVEVNRSLNAFLIDLLAEIAVPIEKTDRHKIQIKIAGRLAVVAGKDAQATGVIWNRFVKTKFSGKIRDGIFDRASGASFSVSIMASQIFLEFLKDLLELAQKILVLRKLFQPILPRDLQHADRIMICSVPKLVIEMPEQPSCRGLPRPPKVETHFPQWLQRRRQDGRDIVNLKSRHANAVTGSVTRSGKILGSRNYHANTPGNRTAVNQENLVRQVTVPLSRSCNV